MAHPAVAGKEKSTGNSKLGMLDQMAHLTHEARMMKTMASDFAEDGMRAARRAIKRGTHAAEDLVEGTAYRIKRDPLRTIGIAFGVGIGLGFICDRLWRWRTRS